MEVAKKMFQSIQVLQTLPKIADGTWLFIGRRNWREAPVSRQRMGRGSRLAGNRDKISHAWNPPLPLPGEEYLAYVDRQVSTSPFAPFKGGISE
ncbi:hypothetical protein FHS90_002481 [Rufibacter quisquiliarum]|uniref:Uncharacterized protein n=1 Tax=Rufibacter quisquiliarum TaxID=1549639 RepID=A0A839GFU8_9BACT|nr:hypothetical protein [Rufibacter quisquiliarum]